MLLSIFLIFPFLSFALSEENHIGVQVHLNDIFYVEMGMKLKEAEQQQQQQKRNTIRFYKCFL